MTTSPASEPVFSVPGTGDPFKDAYTRAELQRAARHARQGAEAALRIFGTITATGTTREALSKKADEAMAKVNAGPAPVAFKSAFDASMHDLVNAARANPTLVRPGIFPTAG